MSAIGVPVIRASVRQANWLLEPLPWWPQLSLPALAFT
jgi:hypothetical protein